MNERTEIKKVIENSIKNKDFKNALSLCKKNSKQLIEKDFYYLTSPSEIEKKLNTIGFDNYKPIKYSSIFFNISDCLKNSSFFVVKTFLLHSPAS